MVHALHVFSLTESTTPDCPLQSTPSQWALMTLLISEVCAPLVELQLSNELVINLLVGLVLQSAAERAFMAASMRYCEWYSNADSAAGNDLAACRSGHLAADAMSTFAKVPRDISSECRMTQLPADMRHSRKTFFTHVRVSTAWTSVRPAVR